MKIPHRLILSLSLLIPLTLLADSLNDRIVFYLNTRYGDTSDTPGAAIIIANRDSIITEYYTGVADLASGHKITSETAFNIASVSKQFTVVALLRCASDSLVDIDSPMSNFVPYAGDLWHKVTPRHLASQSSGIPDIRDRSNRMACVYATDETSKEFFPLVNSTLFSPGTAYDYVNPTFILLADIVSKVSNVDFFKYQQDSIFTPLGMKNTYYFNPCYMPSAQSHAYKVDGTGKWREFDYGEETFFATRPDGGIYSTARDMLAWEKALTDELVLPAKWRDMAYTPHCDVASSPWCDYQRRPYTWYGLGWFINAEPGRPRKVFHTGDNGGYQTYVCKYPDNNVRIIVLENRNDLDRWKLATDIENILIDAGILIAD